MSKKINLLMRYFIPNRNLFLSLIILTSVCSCSTKIQNSIANNANLKKQIVGTWQICNIKDSLEISNYGGRVGQKRYKLITPESFLVVDFIDYPKVMFGAFMGSYTIENNIYTEFIQYAGNGYQKYLAEENSFSLKIDGNYMTIKGINNPYGPELWKRIK